MTQATPTRGGLHRPAGSTGRDGWSLWVDPQEAGWSFAGLRVVQLGVGESRTLDTGDDEVTVVPLTGACRVSAEGETFELAGRADVFAGATDFAYVPRDSRVTIASDRGGRFALPSARAQTRLPFRYRAAADVAVELRGAGACSREVRNFAAAGAFEADRLIAVEVLTPGGNWGSFPPHKHDEERLPAGDTPGETELEEIYYYELGSGPAGAGRAYQRVYGAATRPIDLLVEVGHGDVVLIPHGWHGPSMAMPGYDLYYLNIMAGPGPERAWRVTDDPAHAWIKDGWANEAIDPRLPFGSRTSG